MNKTKYNIRHIRCTMDDFYSDRHRFRFSYDGKEYTVGCYAAFDVIFDEDWHIPEEVQEEIQDLIWKKIDSDESKWRYPAEAYRIADQYCKENFCSA